jgi:hypothetical protein
LASKFFLTIINFHFAGGAVEAQPKAATIVINQKERLCQGRGPALLRTPTQLVFQAIAGGHHPPPGHFQPGLGGRFYTAHAMTAVKGGCLPV